MATELNYRTFVVANPVAAAGRVREQWDLIERLLSARIPELDAAFTEGPGHATVLTREALRAGWEMIVCVGGDGTLNEVVNGFFEKSDARESFRREGGWIRRKRPTQLDLVDEEAVLGLVPIGTGGDFRRTVGLMGGIRESIEHLSGRHARPIDVGELVYTDFEGGLESRLFVNIASAGFSGSVDQIANNTWKGFGAKGSFVLASLRAFMKWRNVEMDVLIGDTVERSGPVFNFVVANGEYFGGGMWVAPGAQLDDGQFQVVEMGDLSKAEMAWLLQTIYRGRHLEYPAVQRFVADHVAARPSQPGTEIRLDLDGETPGRLPAFWDVHQRALRLKF